MAKLSIKEKATNAETMEHILQVQKGCNKIAMALIERGHLHDRSKLDTPEVEYFTKYKDELKDLTYNSLEYKECLDKMRPAIDHHYITNRHHPEFYEQFIEWQPIIIDGWDFTGYYEVSNYGNIRSLSREVKRAGNKGNLTLEGQILKANITPKGYCRIQLSKNDRKRAFMVHRLVANAFLENPENKPSVNHKNGDKQDNRVTNLEWMTYSENEQHSYDNELRKSSIKYAVTCTTLDITTLGCEKMAKELRKHGYEKASPAGVWKAITEGTKHLNLEFEGIKFEEWMRSPISEMNLIDIMELISDWWASSKRTKHGNIRNSIEQGIKRFDISPQLASIMRNTIEILEEGIE